VEKKVIPTKPGDVLILQTKVSYTIYAVGSVALKGQQDFHRRMNVRHVRTRSVAIAAAKAMVIPTGRIYFLDIDTGEWSEIDRGT
jgi:hypothetical protein